MLNHSIELSTAAVLATRKVFNLLSIEELIAKGFSENEFEALGELYNGAKECIENIEMNSVDEVSK